MLLRAEAYPVAEICAVVGLARSTLYHAAALRLHLDKDQLRQFILVLRGDCFSYREIDTALGLHWTRVGQLFKRHDVG